MQLLLPFLPPTEHSANGRAKLPPRPEPSMYHGLRDVPHAQIRQHGVSPTGAARLHALQASVEALIDCWEELDRLRVGWIAP